MIQVKTPGLGTLSLAGALQLIQLRKDLRAGTRDLPPEIEECKAELAAATRNAELFMHRMRAVDNSMVQRVVDLKIELDRLYHQWAEGQAA